MILITKVLKSLNVGMSSFVFILLIFLNIIHLYNIAPKYVNDTDMPAPTIPYFGMSVTIVMIVMTKPINVAYRLYFILLTPEK